MSPPATSFHTPKNTVLAASASRLLGDVYAFAPGARVTLRADVEHGSLTLTPDGSFRYRPANGYVGPDSFRYVLTIDGQTSGDVDVALEIDPVDAPSAGSVAPFTVGSTSGDGSSAPGVSFGSLGPLAFSFEWLIPSLVVSGPGLLVLLVIGAQLVAGAAWLPIVRRNVGDFGLAARRARRGA